MAVSTYRHGVTWRDIPTSIVAPVTADSGIPFIVGTVPINQIPPVNRPPANRPRVYYSYESAVSELGYSDLWREYTLCQAIYTYFALFNVGPIVCSYVNDMNNPAFNDPDSVLDDTFTFRRGRVLYMSRRIIAESLVVASEPTGDAGRVEYVEGVDYVGSWMRDPADGENRYSLSAIPGGAIPTDVDHLTYCSWDQISGLMVGRTDIIGGLDPATGRTTGIEVIEDVFPIHTIVPTILFVPFWMQDPEIAAVCAAKVEEINGCFKGISLADLDSTIVRQPMDANEWKNQNNYTDARQTALWPRVGLVDRDIWLSTELGARILLTDRANGNIPVETPSNKNLRMNRTLIGSFDGITPPEEIVFSKDYGDHLNGQGIITAINWIGGWKAWGSNMACYPAITDPKDRWMPARRMTDFVGNTLVLTLFQKVDKPGNRRLIDQIIDTANIWLNSLVSSGNALGARVEFRHDENPDTNLIDGHYTFHVYEFFPLPAEWIEFILELDISYLSVLFTPAEAA